ncbi:5'-3' exoribonuclease 2 [Nilaparvata lugens]|uniref:5'-3' exoribonuclease 2 n=1 Tax=Nilaparvata lugens TaxID=108931 RepID=UPI00193CF8F5|nr:5'-3' exoribonuclease 2 [Nilaparvata lugens]
MAARILMLALCLGVAWAQYNQYQQTTPVPILKQINRHNEDGSYSYGYEAADGSFKIETKHPSGEVSTGYQFPHFCRYSAPAPQPAYRPAPQANYYKAPAPAPAPQQNYYNPPAPQPNYYNAPPQAHQAIKNIDYITGSYSVTYKKK